MRRGLAVAAGAGAALVLLAGTAVAASSSARADCSAGRCARSEVVRFAEQRLDTVSGDCASVSGEATIRYAREEVTVLGQPVVRYRDARVTDTVVRARVTDGCASPDPLAATLRVHRAFGADETVVRAVVDELARGTFDGGPDDGGDTFVLSEAGDAWAAAAAPPESAGESTSFASGTELRLPDGWRNVVGTGAPPCVVVDVRVEWVVANTATGAGPFTSTLCAAPG